MLEEGHCDASAVVDCHTAACELVVVDGAIHAFDSVRPKATITQDFRDAQLTALSAGLGAG